MKKLFLCFVLLCGFMLTGCAKLTELSDQESDMLAEYMAGSLLKYDKNYEEALINPEYIKESEAREEVQDTDSNSETVDNGQTDNQVSNSDETKQDDTENQEKSTVSLESLFKQIKKDSFDISYTKYKTYDSYSEKDGYLVVESSQGKQLVVVNFEIKNNSKKKQSFNLIESGLEYQLNLDGTVYGPMMTLLMNDIQYINLDLDPGEKTNAVIVFHVKKGTDLSKANVTIGYQDKTTIIDLNK